MNIELESSEIKAEFFEKGFVKRNFGDMDEGTFVQLTKTLGKLLPIGRHNLTGSRYVQNVSEGGLFRREEVPWHNDFSYSLGDYDGTILMMKSFENRVPTYFFDTTLIYDELDHKQRDELSDIECSFVAPTHYHDLLSESQLQLVLKNRVKKKLIFEHPITKNNCLYFSPATLYDSSREFDVANFVSIAEKNKKAVYYDKNDIVIFDNLRWMHKRPAFDGHRQLWRISFSYIN